MAHGWHAGVKEGENRLGTPEIVSLGVTAARLRGTVVDLIP